MGPDNEFDLRLFFVVCFKGQETPVCRLASRYGLEREFVSASLFYLFQVVLHLSGECEFRFTEYKRFVLGGPYFRFSDQVLTFLSAKKDVSGARRYKNRDRYGPRHFQFQRFRCGVIGDNPGIFRNKPLVSFGVDFQRDFSFPSRRNVPVELGDCAPSAGSDA